MKNSKLPSNQWRLAGLAFAAAWLAVACVPHEPQSVEERAQQRWNHMVAGEYKDAWAYLSPGFRETTNAETYAANMNTKQIRYISATVVGSDCGEETCKVRTEVTYRVPGAPTGINTLKPSRIVRENWILAEDRWWLVPQA